MLGFVGTVGDCWGPLGSLCMLGSLGGYLWAAGAFLGGGGQLGAFGGRGWRGAAAGGRGV